MRTLECAHSALMRAHSDPCVSFCCNWRSAALRRLFSKRSRAYNSVMSSIPGTVPGPIDVVSTRDGYDRWAQIYDNEENPLILLEEAHVKDLLGDVRALTVADIGCGTGRNAFRLAGAGAEVTAVDYSEAMLQRARAKPGADVIRFLQHDLATRLPFADEVFDRVLCYLVIDHIADLESFFRELKRICKDEGCIVASVMHPA